MNRLFGVLFQALVVTLLIFFSPPRESFEAETWIDQANSFLREVKFHLRGPTQPSSDVVVVSVGEESLSQIGEWPWKRRYQAALIDSIFKKGAKNLGLDIVWSERDSSDAYDNQILQAVLEKHSEKITFAFMAQCLGKNCAADRDFSDVIRNDPVFEKKMSSSGFLNASRSARGKIDKAIFWLQDQNQRYPSMPLATAAKRLGQDPFSLVEKKWSYLNFSGPAGTLPRIEASCFFDQMGSECELKENTLAGKTVILGVTALGVGDQVATAFDKVVDGLEIQADLTDQILQHRIPRQWPLAAWICFAGLSGILLLGAYFLGNLQLLFSFSFLVVMVFGVDIWLFSKGIFLDSAIFYANAVFLGISSFSFRFYQEFRQKQFLRSAFSRYLSPQVVKILMKNPEVLRLGGQKKEITVLFCDLRNFTGISEKLEPERLTALLNEILTLLTEVIFKYGGTVDKYIGDAVMAFFNAPLNQPDHAFLACAAAQEMAQRILEMKDSFQSRFGVEIKIGIGINTGEAHVGNLGSDQRFNYSVLGDAVNIAARVESATKETGVTILTTRATLEAIEKIKNKILKQRSMGKINLKGKAEPIELFEVLELS